MKSRFKPVVLGMAVVMGLTGISVGGTYAAQSDGKLDWSYQVPTQFKLDRLFDLGTFAGDKLYLPTLEGRNSNIVQAFGQEDGDKSRWTYDFQGSAKEMTNVTSFAVQDKEGNSYFLSKKDADKKYKLEAIDANGKLKWSKEVNDQAIGHLSVLDNGDIVASGIMTLPKNAKGSQGTQTFCIFGKDGTLKATKQAKEANNPGVNWQILPEGRVLGSGNAAKIQVFKSLDDMKKPILEYAVPQKPSVDFYIDFDVRVSNAMSFPAVYSLGGGDTLIQFRIDDMSAVPFKEGQQEVDLNTVKQSKLLVMFDANGQKKWERQLNQDEGAMPTANGYAVQRGSKIELYGKDNKLKTSKTFNGSDLWMTQAKKTDEIVVTSKKEGTFAALDPKDLSVKYELDMKKAADAKSTYSFLYEGKGELYVYSVDGSGKQTVSHYELK
ncbi:hypothetical protein CDO73_20775 [Saccharibacillus sp. O23]|uniref:outer membrane protein assembly factor BamB family protein n=1 Tax=Saccharibacillus sp. O23 TaxID=2009338 RepID=UPI000B4E711E|nr:PQQ-binding-like beta-propeller repeat protein [Saccharibacillus sp. O23]OWR27789.1 hypothetical protein CDO73_20775 [Saccharibacillus sp. O23]